jgi:chorismate lyase / 3-hydroxybenzoate synthase
MRTSLTATSPAIVRRSADPLEAPPLAAWVEDLFAGASAMPLPNGSPQHVVLRERRDFLLISVRVSDALSLSVSGLESQIFAAYQSLARQLDHRSLHAVRFWNHIPHINERMDDGRDRYMVFNAARYRAFCEWYGGPNEFERQVATASGIGHCGRDLFIHCFAMQQPGVAVENPRQVAPYHYSKRFGPLPPAFARATVLSGDEALPARILVGGTASVRGEDSVYLDNLARQLDETFENLAALVSAAKTGVNGKVSNGRSSLARFRELRAYVPDESNVDEAIAAISAAFPALQRLEILRADLCRPELMVEIEGIAD